jgi:hypothetical protein
MPDVKKTKICLIPNFEFEAVIATFIDKQKFEIIPLDTSTQGLMDKYGQEIYGDWCAPLKFFVAMYERAVEEKGIEKIISISANICSYPMVLGDLQKWINKDVEYYPILTDELSPSLAFIRSAYQQLSKALPGLTLAAFTQTVPTAYKRMKIAKDIKKLYFANLPLVKNPKLFKTYYNKIKNELINAESIKKSEAVKDQWAEFITLNKIRKKPKLKMLISGDISISFIEFILFDIDVFLANHEVEIIQINSSYYLDQFSERSKQARQIMSDTLSNKYNQAKVSNRHYIELTTIYKILKGIDQKIDGIVFIRPIMCAPCNNVSYILKKENCFNIPLLEISYDEHSGLNGIITRLEAFLNIIQENN